MSQLRVITFSDKELASDNKLLLSCDAHDLDLTVLTFDGKWNSNAIKIKLLYDFLSSADDEQMLLVTDAFDVLINASEVDIIRAFTSLEGDIIFGAEANFYFWNHHIKAEYQRTYPTSPTLYRYLNSGTMMGKVAALQELLSDIIIKNELRIEDADFFTSLVSDQYLYTKHYVEHALSTSKKYTIQLDHSHVLFEVTGGRSRVLFMPHVSSTHAYNSFKLERAVLKFLGLNRYQRKLIDINYNPQTKEYKNTVTGTHPLVIHLPGTGQFFDEVMESLHTNEKKLGFKHDPGKKPSVKHGSVKKLARQKNVFAKGLAVFISLICYVIALCIPVKLTI